MATLAARIAAFAIDTAIVTLIFLLIQFIFRSQDTIIFLLILPIISFYNLFFSLRWMGQSPGKMLMKIRVVSLSGNTPTLKSYLVRWIFRLVDIYLSFGSFAVLSILSSDKGQRLGDLLAGTTVISTAEREVKSFDSIEQMGNVVIDPKFNDLSRYNDEQMLLVKQTLVRFRENPTLENEQLIISLSNKFIEDLDIVEGVDESDRFLFLQEVLDEYVLVTR